MEELLLLLLDLLLQGAVEVLWELGASAYKARSGRPNRGAFSAVLGYGLLGAAVGGLSLLVWPTRLVGSAPLPGASLVLAPLGVGGLMHAWGRLRRQGGHTTTRLASFAGGAAFAFGTALVRFCWAA